MTVLPDLPERPRDAHKGRFGTCLLVGGSTGMTGAIILAARAALRSGVGLTRVALPESCLQALPVAVPEATSLGLPGGPAAAQRVLDAAEGATAVGIGPGLSQSEWAGHLVHTLLKRLVLPVVLDADGLNVIAGNVKLLRERNAPTIITPHPGEAARLLGEPTTAATVQADRENAARELVERTGATVVLKGAGTLIATPDALHVNPTGNPGMATGGSGDVLTGIVAALLAQGMVPLEAARLGAWAHGRAGDLAAEAGSEAGLTAGDIVAQLRVVWRLR